MAPTGMRVSPMGIALISIMICGSLYYVFIRTKPLAEGQVSLRALLIAGIDFAERGGEKVREVKEKNNMKEESKGETLEGANDPVTLGDRLSNQAMTASFRASFPNVPLVSEEKDSKLESYIPAPAPTKNSEVYAHAGRGDDIVNQEDVTIWVDPLDATQEYTENLLQYVTTMVCVAVKGRPVIGIIHKPFEGKTYWGWVGHGTNIEERKLASDGMHRIIVSRSHAGKVDVTAKKAFGKKANVVPAGGAGFKSLALFNGYASVYLHTSLIKKWDICAGNAILNQAGGKMTTLSGSAINYSFKSDPKNDAGLVAALHNHDEYLKQLGYS